MPTKFKFNKEVVPVFVFIILIILITQTDIFNHGYYEKCCEFYQTDVHGVVVDYSSSTGGNLLKLNDNLKKWVVPVNYKESKFRFEDLIEKGDSISKNKNSDTLFVFKNNTRYPLIIENICSKIE